MRPTRPRTTIRVTPSGFAGDRSAPASERPPQRHSPLPPVSRPEKLSRGRWDVRRAATRRRSTYPRIPLLDGSEHRPVRLVLLREIVVALGRSTAGAGVRPVVSGAIGGSVLDRPRLWLRRRLDGIHPAAGPCVHDDVLATPPTRVRRTPVWRARGKGDIQPLSDPESPRSYPRQFFVLAACSYGALGTGEGSEAVLYRDPPVRSLENFRGAQLDPRKAEASTLLLTYGMRGPHLHDRRGRDTPEEHDVGHASVLEPHLLGRMRDIRWKVLHDAAVAAIGGARASDTRCRPILPDPTVHHGHDPPLGRPVKRALRGASFSAAVREVRAACTPRAQHEGLATTRTPVATRRIGRVGPYDGPIFRIRDGNGEAKLGGTVCGHVSRGRVGPRKISGR